MWNLEDKAKTKKRGWGLFHLRLPQYLWGSSSSSSSVSSFSSSPTTTTAPLNIGGRRPSTCIRRQSHRRCSSQLYDALQEVMQQSRLKRQGSSQHLIPANTSKNICCGQGIWKGQWRSFLVSFRCLANFQINSKNVALIRRPLCFLKSNITPIFCSSCQLWPCTSNDSSWCIQPRPISLRFSLLVMAERETLM